MAELYDVMFFDSRLLSVARFTQAVVPMVEPDDERGGAKPFAWSSVPPRGQKHKRSVTRSRFRPHCCFKPLAYDRPIRVTGHVCAHRNGCHAADSRARIDSPGRDVGVGKTATAQPAVFKPMAQRMFGHTEHKHDLVTQHERAAKKFNVRVGSLVSFDYEGKSTLAKSSNHATRDCAVPDPTGTRYTMHCYRKFRCRLAHLRPPSHRLQ